MRKRIPRIYLNQTAWTMAVMMFFIGIIYMIVAMIIGLINNLGVYVLYYLFAPFVYAIGTYIGYIILYAFYNLAATITGGIEFKLDDKDETADQ